MTFSFFELCLEIGADFISNLYFWSLPTSSSVKKKKKMFELQDHFSILTQQNPAENLNPFQLFN